MKSDLNNRLDLAVIAPTRNEAGNIRPFLERLSAALSGIRYKVIFVDDSSDETPMEIKKYDGERITLVHRPPEERNGLGGAVVRGFREASGARYLAAINVDLQHPPEVMRQLYEKARATGADFVLPSRFVRGGSAHGLHSLYRQFVSWGLRMFVRILFYPRLRRVSDPGSGMYLFKYEVVEGVSLNPRGFKILLEMLIKGAWRTVEEVPYAFASRASGTSKATFRRGIDALFHIAGLFAYYYFARFVRGRQSVR